MLKGTNWRVLIRCLALLENYKRMAGSVRSKSPNCKQAISNVITRKDKNEIDKKRIHSILNFPNFAKRTK